VQQRTDHNFKTIFSRCHQSQGRSTPHQHSIAAVVTSRRLSAAISDNLGDVQGPQSIGERSFNSLRLDRHRLSDIMKHALTRNMFRDLSSATHPTTTSIIGTYTVQASHLNLSRVAGASRQTMKEKSNYRHITEGP